LCWIWYAQLCSSMWCRWCKPVFAKDLPAAVTAASCVSAGLLAVFVFI